MPPKDLTPEDIADWLTPRQALAILDEVFREADLSKAELLERLRGGMVQAISIHASIDGRVRAAGAITEISTDDWRKIWGSDTVWVTGTLSVEIKERGSYGSSALRYFDVRFEPSGINAIVAPLLPSKPPSKDEAIDDDVPRGPPVSPDALKAWFDVYQKVYGNTPADTLDNALKSARGMFPGKFVARDRIRDLAGGRTPGRKARKDS
jgi:hypothetical protein